MFCRDENYTMCLNILEVRWSIHRHRHEGHGFDSAHAYNLLGFCQKHAQAFLHKYDEICEKFIAKCKNPKNIKTLTRIFCMSTLGHKQESSVWTKFSNFHSKTIQVHLIMHVFFPNLCFVFVLAHTILKNMGIKTDFQFYTA